MNVIETKIKDLLILEPRVFADNRGWFMESFNQTTFNSILSSYNQSIVNFVQDNHSILINLILITRRDNKLELDIVFN